MSSKIVFFVCAQAIIAQTVFGQCIGYAAPIAPCAAPSSRPALPQIAQGCGAIAPVALDIAPTSGGAFPVTSTSLIAPTGLAVTSENVFEGALNLIGELPFLGTVGFENVLGSSGAGVVNYSCGNGVTAIESIAPSYGASNAPAITPGYASGVAPWAGSVGLGCGCNRGY